MTGSLNEVSCVLRRRALRRRRCVGLTDDELAEIRRSLADWVGATHADEMRTWRGVSGATHSM